MSGRPVRRETQQHFHLSMNSTFLPPRRATPRHPSRIRLALRFLVLPLFLNASAPLLAQPAGEVGARADYRNVIHTEPLNPAALVATNVSRETASRVVDLLKQPEFNTVALFGGSAAISNTTTFPNNGVVHLQRSVIGQPVGGAPFRIPGERFYLGQLIEPATNLNARPGLAPHSITPPDAAVAIDVGGRTNVYAAHDGPVEIRWIGNDGQVLSPITYRIERPEDALPQVKLYHTHAESGNLSRDEGRVDDPEVYRVIFPSGKVVPVIHWNTTIPFVDPTNNPTVLFDARLGELRARPPASGYLLFEYRNQNGAFLGVEPVLVTPTATNVTAHAEIGYPITPHVDLTGGLSPYVSRGFVASAPYDGYIYQHQTNAQAGLLWAIRANSDHTNMQVYWRRTGVAGIEWPYLLQHYISWWPTNISRYQSYVRGSTTNRGPDVVVPGDGATRLLPYMDPAGHAGDGQGNGAGLLSNGRFSTTSAGWSLLQFALDRVIAFQVVRSVLHHTVSQDEVDWEIGQEITDDDHQGKRGGYIHVLETKSPKEDRYHYEIYHGSTNLLDRPAGFDWMTNRILAVNKGALEVWWSNVNTNGNVQWPSRVKRYNNDWPGEPKNIVIASQVGSGPLPSDDARLYVQNDPTKPGFNPNDEHAQLLPQRGPAESQMEVFPTAVNVLEGAWASARITLPTLTNDTDTITLSVSGARSGSNHLLAGFRVGTNFTDTLVLERQSWSTAQTLYFTLSTNALSQPIDAITNRFTLRAQGAFSDVRAIHARAVPSNVLDLVVETAALRLPEGGSRSFHVGLTLPPRAEVQVAVSPPPHLTARPALLSFTPDNWSTPQEVTISSPPGVSVGDVEGQVRLTASGGLSVEKTVDVTRVGSGSSALAAYALRNDLGVPHGSASLEYSQPYVLVTYTDGHGVQKLEVYRVDEGDFTYPGVAGRLLQPPYPLSIYQGWEGPSYATNSPAAWEDRKQFWWARSGPDDGGRGSVPIVMKFFYPDHPSFFFPSEWPKPKGTDWIPWLDRRHAPTEGIPVDVVFRIRWPDDIPELRFGESLVKAKFGLPTIKGQTSVDLVYEQTEREGHGPGSSAKLIDAAHTYSAPLAELPGDTLGKTITNLTSLGEIPSLSVFFAPLPPHLRSRIWWESAGGPDGSGALKFKGQFVDEFGTEEPVGYLLLNVLTARDTNFLAGVSEHPTFWSAVRNLRLPTQAGQVRLVPTNTVQGPARTFALTAGLAQRSGFVTLAFNNVIAPREGLGALRGTPVSLEIIRVSCPSYRGETKVVYPQDPFDERVNLRHSGDFAGQADGYEFQWQFHPVVAGQGRPDDGSTLWQGTGLPQGFGISDITVGGAGAQSLADWWYRCSWRSTNSATPCGTNFTAWTGPTLVEGWIKRVLGRINLFEQANTNYDDYEVNTIANMLAQSGTRWIGSVPLNTDAVDDFGLISVYETILQRGIKLSIEGNPPTVRDSGVSRALLLAAAQLGNLYTLFGNEAYADAADPTIGFVTTGAGSTFGVEATAKHCFMGQVDSLLQEELALLRGLGDTTRWDFRQHPYYNRLRPNNGEAAPDEAKSVYNLNYAIADLNADATNSAVEAQLIFPQGHGDAWGHYLMAIKNFYRLLRNPNFAWLVTDEQISLPGGQGTVRMNYQYERRFAAIAAAKARTGAEIVNLTYRSRYVENPDGQWQGYADPDTDRAWGLSEWAARSGEGAYYDWVVGNALLPPVDVVNPATAIAADRTTVTELREVAAAFTTIQDQLDNADAGLNPLGLSKNVLPFDIDPSRVDAGETHFEQIYGRAVKAINNAIGVFNRAQTARQKLREQADEVGKFRRDVDNRETDFNNRLIEVFGYPYPADPAYEANPNTPDLYHFMYSDYSDITGEVTPPTVEFTVQFGDFVVSPRGELTRVFTPVAYHTAANGFGLVKPPHWTRPRRAPGEIQMSHSELLQTTGRFKRALLEYESLLAQIEDQSELLRAQYNLNATEIYLLYSGMVTQESLNAAIRRARVRQLDFQKGARMATLVANALAEAMPKTAGIIGGLANGIILDPSFGARQVVLMAGNNISESYNQHANQESIIELDHQQAKESASAQQNIQLTTLRQEQAVLQQVAQLQQLVRQEALLRLEIYNQQEALQQAAGRYASTLARGQRLIEERTRFRQATASDVQQYRFKDMAFRIFRDEAIQQYRAQFDLAGRYVYLAAAAFDFETNLRDVETRWKPASTILTDIVRARSIGVIDGTGNPQPGPRTGDLGDGGLAAAMWNLNHQWSEGANSLKTQLGFNNPARETLTFSLRSGHFRALTNQVGDATWRAWLSAHIVPHVGDLPEFRRYCSPPSTFGLGGRSEPGIVIPFTSSIHYRQNFFGWPEQGGGANFSSSYFATKIKSTAVKFIGWDAVNLNTAPHIYLIPVGNDVLLSPVPREFGAAITREWRILDQFLPAQVPLTDLRSTFPSSDWIPHAEMDLRDRQDVSLISIRRYAQMRAYHDSSPNGTPTQPELEAYKRLVGRSAWNTRWLLIILGGDLLGADPDLGIRRLIHGANNDGEGIQDIELQYSTYSYPGN